MIKSEGVTSILIRPKDTWEMLVEYLGSYLGTKEFKIEYVLNIAGSAMKF